MLIIFTLTAARGHSKLVCQYLLLLKKRETMKRKVEEEAALCPPMELGQLLRSDTENEECNRFSNLSEIQTLVNVLCSL